MVNIEKDAKEIIINLTYGTNDASGVVWACSRHLRLPCHITSKLQLKIYKILVNIYKNAKEIIKKLTYGPNDARCVVWACSRHPLHPRRVLGRLQLYDIQNIC